MLKLKMVMNMPYVCDPGELVHEEWLDRLCQELQSEHPPLFGFTYCLYAAPYDR